MRSKKEIQDELKRIKKLDKEKRASMIESLEKNYSSCGMFDDLHELIIYEESEALLEWVLEDG